MVTPAERPGPSSKHPAPLSPAPSQGGKADDTPLKKLEKFRQELSEAEGQLASQTIQRDNLRKTIAELEKTVTQLQQSASGAEQVLASLRKERKAAEDFFKAQWKVIEPAVGEKKEAIEQIIREEEEKIDEQDAAVTTKRQELRDKQQAHEQAQQDLATKQARFAETTGRLKTLQDAVPRVQELRKKIEALDPAVDPGTMYVLASDLKDAVEAMKIPTREEHEQELTMRGNELAEASRKAVGAKTTADAAAAQLAAEEKKLSDLKAKRTQTILSRVKELGPPASATTP